MKKRKTDPCKGCVWAARINEGLVFCPFPRCVRGKLPTGGGRKDVDNGQRKKTGVDC